MNTGHFILCFTKTIQFDVVCCLLYVTTWESDDFIYRTTTPIIFHYRTAESYDSENVGTSQGCLFGGKKNISLRKCNQVYKAYYSDKQLLGLSESLGFTSNGVKLH